MAETTEKVKKTKVESFKLVAEEMAQAGLHFGHKTSKANPKMKPYLFGSRSDIHIIDLEKTKEKFEEALRFIQDLAGQGKTILFVGTKVQTKNLTKEIAVDCGMPYVSERWLGGTFTNFETILKRINYFKDLEQKKASGELGKYTKKEQSKFNHELKRLEIKLGGIKEMSKLPDALFVSDMKKEEIAVREAKARKIKVIAIVDTNCDPTLADFPIPANDDAVSSVKYIIDKIKEVIIKAKSKIKKE